MGTLHHYGAGEQSASALGRSGLAFMQSTDFRNYGRPDASIQLPRLQDAADLAVQDIQHMLGTFAGKRGKAVDDFAFLEKYPVHPTDAYSRGHPISGQ